MSTLEIIVKTHIEDDVIYYTALYKDSIHTYRSEKVSIRKCLNDYNNHNKFTIIDRQFKNNKWVYIIKLDD